MTNPARRRPQFLDGFYLSRIGIRMLIGQHIALHEPQRENHIGGRRVAGSIWARGPAGAGQPRALCGIRREQAGGGRGLWEQGAAESAVRSWCSKASGRP